MKDAGTKTLVILLVVLIALGMLGAQHDRASEGRSHSPAPASTN